MTNTSSSISTFSPDLSSPLYIHSSDIPGTCLVSVPFSGTAFGGWKRYMIVCLSAKNKIGFVDGSCPKPSDNSPELKQWSRCNNMVISWLTSSLSPEIANSVKYSNNAQSIWQQLEKRYGVVNGTKVFEIKKELASTQQDSMDIASYFNKLKRLWNELGVMRESKRSECTCAAKIELQKELEEDKLYQFLMGLNDVYMTVRSNLLMMQPLPSLDVASSILRQDENQRQVHFNPQINQESASFNVNNNSYRKPSFPNASSSYGQNKSSTNDRNFNQNSFSQKVNFERSKANMFCRYCRKNGNVIEDCHKLLRINQNSSSNFNSNGNNSNSNSSYNPNRARKTAANVSSEIAFLGGEIPISDCGQHNQESVVRGLTRQQYQQLINLLQNAHPSSDPQANLMASANFAGPFSEEASGA